MKNPFKKIPVLKRVIENNRIGRLDFLKITGITLLFLILSSLPLLITSYSGMYKEQMCKAQCTTEYQNNYDKLTNNYDEVFSDNFSNKLVYLEDKLKSCKKNCIYDDETFIYFICMIFFLFFVIIIFYFNFISAKKRFHDLNMSGWWIIGYYIPYVGFIFWIILQCIPGNVEKNKYGSHIKDFEKTYKDLKSNKISEEEYNKKIKSLNQGNNIIKDFLEAYEGIISYENLISEYEKYKKSSTPKDLENNLGISEKDLERIKKLFNKYN